jgi:ATP-dependent protease ClpP protease subunit
MRLHRTPFASSLALSLMAACVAGPAQKKPEARRWYTMTAKGAVGEIHILDAIFPGLVSAQSFQRDLKALGDVTSLEIHINSPGGDVFEGTTIHNMIKAHKAATKTVIIDGLAASIASIIAMAGDKIVMPKNAMMMIHDPSMVAWGRPEDLTKAADTLTKVRGTLVSTYADRTGLDAAEVAQLMAEETWFTAQEAVDKGFADETTAEVKMAASWSAEIKNFKNTPPAFLAALAGTGPARETGTHRPATAEHNLEVHVMDRTALLALAAALGLAITGDLNTVIEALITGKADMGTAIAALVKLKPAASALPTEAELTAKVQAAVKAERDRVANIRAVAATLKLAGIKEVDAAVDAMIADGTTLEDARAKLIEARAKHEDKIVINGAITFGGATDTFDNPAFRRDALATAFAHRSQPGLIKVTDQAKPFVSHSIIDLAVYMLEAQGTRVATRDRAKIIAMALHSTSDFPFLLGDVGNKILLAAYDTAKPTYRMIGAQKVFNDFKPTKFMRAGDFPNLLQVGETGEIKRGTMSENKETVTLASYARILGISRQALINDDLGAFTDLAAAGGRRVAIFENDTFYAVLALNTATGPTMRDTYALFDSTNHGNYTSSGTAVNVVVELGKLRAKINKQVSLDSVKLNLDPTILLVGPDNVAAADQVTTQVTAATQAAVNKFGPTLTRVMDANITSYKWYLLCDPAVAPALVWGSLPGQAGPMVSTKEGWDTQGVEVKVERDFAAGAVDYRPIALNAGTAPS